MPDTPEYRDWTTVVTVGREKHAKAGAIFFDHIIPLAVKDVPKEVIASDTPPAFMSGPAKLKDRLISKAQASGKKRVKVTKDGSEVYIIDEETDMYNIVADYFEKDYFACSSEIRPRLALALRRAGFLKCPVMISSPLTSPGVNQDCISVALSNINFIDFDKASWEQIVDLRKDVSSARKVKNLRLFFHSKYENKDPNFIHDDLEQRLYQYETALKDKGFELITSTFSTTFLSKDLLAVSGSIGAAALFGSPLVLAGAGAIGALITIGKGALTIVKGQHDITRFTEEHDLAYIVDAKKKINT